MRITALAGGVGGARFLRGLLHHLRPHARPRRPTVTVIGNTGDDITLFGLRVCPDLDTLLYTLGGGIHEGQGWGRADETHTVAGELAAYGAVPQWFALGDRDFGTHVVRSQLLGQGVPLSRGHRAALPRAGGCPSAASRLLPMTDAPVETHVVVEDERGTERAIHFQEWWVRHAGRAAGAAVRGGRHGPRGPGTRRARRDPRGRRRPAAAEQPGRLDRHHPRRARGAGRPARHPRARRRRLAAHRRAPRCAGTPTRAWPPSGSRRRRRGRRALRGLPGRLAGRRRRRGRRPTRRARLAVVRPAAAHARRRRRRGRSPAPRSTSAAEPARRRR